MNCPRSASHESHSCLITRACFRYRAAGAATKSRCKRTSTGIAHLLTAIPVLAGGCHLNICWCQAELQPAQVATISDQIQGARSDDEFRMFIAANRSSTVKSHPGSHQLPLTLLMLYTALPPLPAQPGAGLQVIAEYGSSWCAHCQEMFPHFQRIASEVGHS